MKNMKKIYTLIFLLLFTVLSSFSQSQNNIILSTVKTEGGTIVAGASIILNQNFSFVSTQTASLTLTVDPVLYSLATNTVSDPNIGKPLNLSSNQTYIKTSIYTKDDKSSDMTSIQYLDGFGRPIQTIDRGITKSGNDLITYLEYDRFGRESVSWLPIYAANNNGAFMPLYPTFERTSRDVYLGGNIWSTNSLFSYPVYEKSPSNRVIKGYGPGDNNFSSRPVVTEYLTNKRTTGELACALFITDGGQAQMAERRGFYPDGRLNVTKIKDEDGNISYEFKNNQDQVILTRQINDSEILDTYYVFDDLGNLCFVYPPLISEIAIKSDYISSQDLDAYIYRYEYDDRNRCIRKKLPGCEPIYYVYDKADRLIFTQDGEQRKENKNEWTFTIPDAFGRGVLTGICKTVNNTNITSGRFDNQLIKADFSTTGKYYGYDIKVGDATFAELTIESPQILSVNYYDNYSFLGKNGFPNYIYDNSKESAFGTRYDNAKGLSTGGMVATFRNEDTTMPQFIYSTIYYDKKGRAIQTKANNHLGGTEIEYIAYNFTDQPTNKVHTHTINGKTSNEYYAYTYDHAGRLIDTKHKLDAGVEVLIASNIYDELGRLQTSKKGNNNTNLTTNYQYNILSWTTSIENPLFTQKLYYNTSFKNNVPLWNGNITGMSWKLKDEAERTYTFKYDPLSRLAHAAYNDVANEGEYNSSYSYDKHGNILNLVRRDKTKGLMDNLAYSYMGNQIKNIHDTGTKVNESNYADFKDYSIDATKSKQEYSYNTNGAMMLDLNKGISRITYNSLNLPAQMDIKSPVAEARNEYIYSADGQKLRMVQKWNPDYNSAPIIGSDINVSSLSSKKTTDYIGNRVYEDGTLKRTLIDGGYIEAGAYYYYLTDHLGNNRVVADANGSPIQKTHYYPFGMAFAESTDQAKQPYKYNGKELDPTHGLNLYDYSARYYDPAYGRFTSIDPFAEKFYSWSPYNFGYCNPIRHIDPTGEGPIDVLRGIGEGLEQKIDALEGLITTFAHKGPVAVIQQIGESLKPTDALIMVGNAMGMGAITSNMPVVDAVSADINGGDGSNTGKVIGGAIFDAAMTVPVMKAEGALGRGTKAAGGIGNTTTKAGAVTEGTTALRKTGSVLESVSDVMANSQLIEGKSLLQVKSATGGANGWVQGTLNQGRSAGKGWMLREMNSKGTDYTGRMIQYHPGTPRHFNGEPYWKVSSGTGGTERYPVNK